MINIGKFPSSSGVYLFKDNQGRPIYIGKAGNLRSRISSYFHRSAKHTPRIAKMISQACSVEIKETEGEIIALLLETWLIQKYQPEYNVKSKDDKSGYYLTIDYSHQYPPVRLSRTIKNARIAAFGPYLETNVVWAIKAIRRMFPWRDCSQIKFSRQQKLARPCLYGQVNLCPAPCQGRIRPEDYCRQLNLVEKFLRGGQRVIIKNLTDEMEAASKAGDYEKAAGRRDQISLIERLLTWKTPPALGSDAVEQEYGDREALEELSLLLSKKCGDNYRYPHRIEAYDISNLAGRNAAGSMVVFIDGAARKEEYRRFRIKETTGPDDSAMIGEVLRRRWRRWPHLIPDLIIIDGGKGQVGKALSATEPEDNQVPIIGITKREEVLVIPNENGLWELIKLARNSSALHLIQRLRDESHRFAIAYHKKIRRKDTKAGF